MACVATADNPIAAAIRTEAKNLFMVSPELSPSSGTDTIGMPYWSQSVGIHRRRMASTGSIDLTETLHRMSALGQ
jgi:hypothetical protein